MFQVERQTSVGYWYEVMLSPFKNLQEVEKYLNKYCKYYPDPNDRHYRVTCLQNEKTV